MSLIILPSAGEVGLYGVASDRVPVGTRVRFWGRNQTVSAYGELSSGNITLTDDERGVKTTISYDVFLSWVEYR